MRAEFEPPEQMDLSQPNPDFALNQNLSAFKLNPKVARVLLPLVLGVAAVTAGAGTDRGSSSNIDTESTPGSPRSPLVTDVPVAPPVENLIPTLTDGNYDFWSIAKIDFRFNPQTGKYERYNLLKPDEIGYVHDLDVGPPPYEIEGYEYKGETYYGGGVTIFEYSPANDRETVY